jgi:hypothetical protein
MTTSFADRVAGWPVVVDDRFAGPELDRSLWLPYYLPQWAGRERSAARYRIADGQLHLFIADDQAAWSPELDGPLRVSSLQTGVFAGALGSAIGQHGINPSARVVEEQAPLRLFTPLYGAFVLRARWVPQPDQMVALWMIGYEDTPERSAEICICEIFGDEANEHDAVVGMGVHPFDDPSITDDFRKLRLPIDVRQWHDYAAVWTERDVAFYVDGDQVAHVEQSPAYAMQFMLNIYDFGRASTAAPSAPFVIERFTAYAPPR